VVIPKIAAVCVEGIVTVAGWVTPVTAVETLIGNPALGAGELMATLHLNEPPTAMVVGLQ